MNRNLSKKLSINYDITSQHNELQISNKINDKSCFQDKNNLDTQQTDKSVYRQPVDEEKDYEYDSTQVSDSGKK